MTRLGPRIVAVATMLLLLFSPTNTTAQTQDTTVVGGGDVLAVVGAGGLLLGTALFLKADSVTCVPCDRLAVPAFDRWAIAPGRPVPATMSDLLLIGIGISSWIDLANEGAAGRAGIVSSLESLLLTEGISELLKRVVARKRPVLYTPEGTAVAGDSRNQQSWPSGHAAGAAALATSYWLTRDRISSGGKNDPHAWLLAAGAVGVAALRVVAAKHFPTDVLSGLALGAATAGLVHTVRF